MTQKLKLEVIVADFVYVVRYFEHRTFEVLRDERISFPEEKNTVYFPNTVIFAARHGRFKTWRITN